MSIFEEISKKFYLPHAWNDWKEYRDGLTDLVIGCGEKTGSKTVSIIGAGRCNDLDLIRLTEHFDKIVLFDNDAVSMEEALSSYGDKNGCRNRVETCVSSLTGLGREELESFFEKVMMRTRVLGHAFTFDKLETILLDEMETMKLVIMGQKEKMSLVLHEADIIVCNGVLSQLLSMVSFFIRSVIASIPGSYGSDGGALVSKTEKKLHEINDEMIPDIVLNIVNASKKAAVFGNEYSGSQPVEGAFQGIESIKRSGWKKEELRRVWDFNRAQGIRYEMLIQTIYK